MVATTQIAITTHQSKVGRNKSTLRGIAPTVHDVVCLAIEAVGAPLGTCRSSHGSAVGKGATREMIPVAERAEKHA